MKQALALLAATDRAAYLGIRPALRKFTESIEWQFYLGMGWALALPEIQDGKDLLEVARRAGEIDNSDGDTRAQTSLLRLRTGDLSGAGSSLAEARKLTKDESPTLDLLTALVRHKQGKIAEGRKHLDAAVKWIDTPEKYNAQPWDVRLRLRMLRDEAKAIYDGKRPGK